jgi:TetR/AcrR family transcriptional regulator
MPTRSIAKLVRRRKVQQRSVETRIRIIESAATEFAEYGFDGASTRRVAERAGVNHPLVGYHFRSKDGLWRAVLKDLNERFATMYRTRLDGLRGVETPVQLRLILEDFIRFAAANPTFHWLMSHEASRGGARMNWLIDQYVRDFFENITGMIKEAQAAGCFVQGDPSHLLYLFVGAATRVYMLESEVKKVMGKAPSTSSFIEEHIRLCTGLFFPKKERY